MATITDREKEQTERANASGRTHFVFIHGLWLLPSSWDNWSRCLRGNGVRTLTPVWPTIRRPSRTRANPDVLAKKTLG